MQQLETYKLKHIGRDDAFGPDTLNANTDAIAEQLARLDAADAAEAARVDAALAQVEAAQLKLASGTYAGNNATGRKISLSFTPKIVYVGDSAGLTATGTAVTGGVALSGKPATYSGSYKLVEIVTDGFQVNYYQTYISSNSSGTTYRYFAIG